MLSVNNNAFDIMFETILCCVKQKLNTIFSIVPWRELDRVVDVARTRPVEG